MPEISPRNISKTSVVALFVVIAALIALSASPALAHNPDTSYARVRILDNRIELRLTFDAFTLKRITPGLDADADLELTREELQSAVPAIVKFLRAHVGLEVNGAATDLGIAGPPFWPLDAPDPLPAKLWHANEALFSFPFDTAVSAPTKDVALFFDVFDPLSARHTVLGSFDHAGGRHEVIFTVAEPDYLFDLAYAKAPAQPQPETRRGNANASPLWEFFREGALHIWKGYDHLCFLLALLVVSRLRHLVAIITSFTIAHSITLTLAAMKVISLPTRHVESAIAATIVYVAVENLVRREMHHRWVLTFAFGLIHGFGFANVLGGLELPRESFVRCLLMFNVGVEAGQLAVVLALLPAGLLIGKWHDARKARAWVSATVGVLGLAWLVDRVFDLGMMPF